jgi:hypothetical protein
MAKFAVHNTYRSLDVQPTGQVVNAGTCQLYGFHVINSAGSLRYLKIYDKATAALSTDTPKLTLALQANSPLTQPIGNLGVNFVNGISIRGTTGIADNDTGAPTVNDIVVALFWDQ